MIDNAKSRNLLVIHVLKDYPKNDHNWFAKNGHICCACGYGYDEELKDFKEYIQK